MQRFLILLALFCGSAWAAPPACPQTSGTLTLNATSPRVSGTSPLLVFFDAAGTTDSSITGNQSVFQDVIFNWNFGDGGTVSGQGVWRFGSKSGYQSKNIATGGMAAHLYQTSGSNKSYIAIVSAVNPSGTKVTCSVAVGTVTDPSNAYPTTATKCVFNATLGAGCPAGATQITTSSLSTAFSSLTTNSRLLFKCGDTFSNNAAVGAVTGFTVGAYGGCENTQTNRPIFKYTTGGAGVDGIIQAAVGNSVPGDGRWMDIDMQGNALAASACWSVAGTLTVTYQQTIYNVNCANAHSNYAWPAGAQMGLINTVGVNQQGAIGTFINLVGNGTGLFAGNVIPNTNYQALIGGSFSGTGDTGGAGDEAVRISGAYGNIIENNDLFDGNSVGAALKLFESNTMGTVNTTITNTQNTVVFDNSSGRWVNGNVVSFSSSVAPMVGGNCNSGGGSTGCYFLVNCVSTGCGISSTFQGSAITFTASGSPSVNGAGSQANFTGIPVQFGMITDNKIYGKSGAQLVEISPQNTCNDEHFLDIVFERNLIIEQFALSNFLLLSGQRETIRNNVFIINAGIPNPSFFNIQYAGRTGSSGSGCTPNPITVQTTQFGEFYNNSFIALSFNNSANLCNICLNNFQLTGNSGSQSFVVDNLSYSPVTTSGLRVVDNIGTGNTLSNNTANASAGANPAFKNFSGSLNVMSDFKPTANSTGGITVPGVLFDALGVPKTGTVDLGAVTH